MGYFLIYKPEFRNQNVFTRPKIYGQCLHSAIALVNKGEEIRA